MHPTDPSFDTWTSLFLIVCAFGFFLSIVLSTDTSNRRKNLPIILLILGFSFILLEYVFYWTGHAAAYPYLYFFSHSWYLAFGPLLYSYIARYHQREFIVQWYHFAPAIVSFLLNAYYLIKSNGFTNLSDYQNELLYHFFWNFRSPWLAVLSLFVYLFVIKDLIKSSETESNTEFARLRKTWTNTLILLFSLFALAYLSFYILVRFPFFNPAWDYAVSFSMTLGIYAIGYFVYKEPSVFNGELFSGLFLKASNGNGDQFSEETKDEFYGTLLQHIETKKPYLDNNLRLVQLADEVGFSSHLLSKIINDQSQKNFNQFINEFRLREAERMLREDGDTSIKSIYYDVGFNNKATFYKAFKRKYKCTPSEFKNSVN
jgi:AraC-like DNA-binding protein